MIGIITDIIACCCGSAPAGDIFICANMTPPITSGVM